MSVPGRLHITWQDDQTLKIETDNGQQTRLLHFDATESKGGDWQGYSKASWEVVPAGRGAPPVGFAQSQSRRGCDPAIFERTAFPTARTRR